jgi:hypothetical protein
MPLPAMPDMRLTKRCIQQLAALSKGQMDETPISRTETMRARSKLERVAVIAIQDFLVVQGVILSA